MFSQKISKGSTRNKLLFYVYGATVAPLIYLGKRFKNESGAKPWS